MGSLDEDRVIVHVPNLFVSFLQQKPRVNPHYDHVRTDSELNVCSKCKLEEHVAKAVKSCDFAYFGAIMAPFADPQRLITICEWGNWIFPFDDLFDDGRLREDFTLARATMDRLLSAFEVNGPISPTEAAPVVTFHDDIWARIRTESSTGIAERYQQAMRNYCTGVLEQVDYFEGQRVPEPEEMLAMRRNSVCVATLYALVEYGHQIDLPSHVFEHPTVNEIETLGIDLTLLHNDILSYRKEESEGVPHNLVATYRMSGLSAQDAMNSVGALIQTRHRSLEEAVKHLPRFGNKHIDQEVSRYIKAIHDVVAANLHWSFKSGRFLTDAQKEAIRGRGSIDVLRRPSYVLTQNIATE